MSDTPDSGMIHVEVAHARPEKQALLGVDVPPGTTVAQAIEASGILDAFPGLVVDPDRLGIFGRRTTPDTVLGDGDRVEIYRPLIADPKEARRKRAAAAGKKK
ncbi:MAG: RnfH family protein [Xanthomonadales bacterium]|nr:RnfH family protein [Xanthomonadales bacterium]